LYEDSVGKTAEENNNYRLRPKP